VLIVGEVHTGLLRGRDPLTGEDARVLVDLVAGEPVLVSERPRSYVRSPARPVGVDCALGVPAPARQVRGIGTAVQRAAITDGHVVQGSAHATIVAGAYSSRQPWSHYLARPGVIETVGRTRWTELAEAFALPRRDPAALDLGAIADRASGQVQRSVPAAGQSGRRLRLARTRLRWVVETAPGVEEPSHIQFGLLGDEMRLLRFTAPDNASADRLAALCEDVALHDWLLTTLIEIVRRAAIGVLGRDEALKRLTPAVDHLLHLWLPGARGDHFSDELWRALERRAGFSRQWSLLAHRIRDQFAAGAAVGMYAATSR
jgi:hypothetical protein